MKLEDQSSPQVQDNRISNWPRYKSKAQLKAPEEGRNEISGKIENLNAE
jgi:hypothetical protein